MESWKVEDSLDVDLDGVDQVIVRIVAGDVTVTSAPGTTTHLDVRYESGDAVHVTLRDGILHVAQPDPRASGWNRLLSMIGSGTRQRCTVAVTAPPHVKVDASMVSAGAVVSGFEGATKVKTVSGDVTLSKLDTHIDVKTVSGDVEAKDITGELRIKTVSGSAAVVDGACRWVDAKTVSGDVLLDLDVDPAGTYNVTTVSGEVALRTTETPNLSVEATTVSGDLVSDFGLGWNDKPGRKKVRATIGDGGARLWVKTVSGDLRVLRGREAAA